VLPLPGISGFLMVNKSRQILLELFTFISERTFAVKADKAACDLNRGLVGVLKQENRLVVSIYFI